MTRVATFLAAVIAATVLLNLCTARMESSTPPWDDPGCYTRLNGSRYAPKQYKIVIARDPNGLEKKVNDMLGGCWHLVGSVAFLDEKYSQVMVEMP